LDVVDPDRITDGTVRAGNRCHAASCDTVSVALRNGDSNTLNAALDELDEPTVETFQGFQRELLRVRVMSRSDGGRSSPVDRRLDAART
jgi:hypothetical protein